jgi:Holliday junction resolvase RusA-like endonuclease
MATIRRVLASRASESPAYRSSDLPRRWQTKVEPADVLLDVAVTGEPIPKGRPRHTRARLSQAGEIIQPVTYTPSRTRDAESEWRWIMLAARRYRQAVPHPVGVLAFFRTGHGTADADNLFKLVADAMNGTVIVDDQQVTEAHVHLLRHCSEPGTELLVWLTPRRRPGPPPGRL